MPITLATNGNLREHVLNYLAQKKIENPNYRVVDIGGSMNPWADELVDTYIDLQPFKTDKGFIQGDICLEHFWRSEFDYPRWDFSICTHVLEDIRNPDLVLRMIQTVSSEGFIAMPNKYTELTPIESESWVGYAHHRWIFTVADGELRMLAKTAIANVFLHHREFLPWMDDSKVSQRGGPLELGFYWKNDIPYQIMGHDLTDAHDPEQVSRFYIDGLAEGI